eukprot:914403-Pelagomonas_calceolata.AAC.1
MAFTPHCLRVATKQMSKGNKLRRPGAPGEGPPRHSDCGLPQAKLSEGLIHTASLHRACRPESSSHMRRRHKQGTHMIPSLHSTSIQSIVRKAAPKGHSLHSTSVQSIAREATPQLTRTYRSTRSNLMRPSEPSCSKQAGIQKVLRLSWEQSLYTALPGVAGIRKRVEKMQAREQVPSEENKEGTPRATQSNMRKRKE